MPADEKEFKIEIGSNLLLAIELVLKSVEKENENHFWRRLHPGKEVKVAFGIDLANIHKENIRPNLSRKLS